MLKLSRRVFTSIVSHPPNPSITNNPPSSETAKEIKPLMNPEMKIKSNLYKRKFPANLIAFSSHKGQKLFQESLKLGNTVSFFPIMEQFQTQNHPTYCGPSTMVVNFNALGIDPHIRWKGPWRWYSEEVISCLKIDMIPKYGMTLEEYGLIAKCNGVFNEIFRPDTDINKTNIEINDSFHLRKNQITIVNSSENPLDKVELEYSRIIEHKHNHNCKKNNSLIIKKADYNLFEASVLASCRRENFCIIINNSRKALKQTGDGHFSPLVAFNHFKSHTLLLDVARFKYFSFWVELKYIWESFFPLDNVIKKPRGFLLTSRFHNLAPEICRKSLDVMSSKAINEKIKKMLNQFSNKKFKLNEFFQVLNDNLLNELTFKSMIVFYTNDLENRTYKINCDSIYTSENSQFEKSELYLKVKPLSDLIFNILWDMKDKDAFKEFIRFYYYLENKYFLELLTLVIISFPDKVFNDLLSMDEEFTNLRRSILQDEFLLREIRTIRNIFGYY